MDFYKFKRKHKHFVNFMIFFFIFSMLLTSMPTEVAYAKITGHDTNTIVPRLNTDGKYEITVYEDDNSFGKTYEQKQKINWANTFGSDKNYNTILSGLSNFAKNKDFDSTLYFSFPGHDSYTGGDNDYNNPRGDLDQAYYVAEKLSTGLNDLISMVDAVDGQRNYNFKVVEDAIKLIAPNATMNPTKMTGIQEVTISGIGKVFYCPPVIKNGEISSSKDGIYYTYNNNKQVVLYGYFVADTSANADTIKNATNSSDLRNKGFVSFNWACLKGYLKPDGTAEENGKPYVSSLSNTNVTKANTKTEESGDTAWISIFDIASVALYYKSIDSLAENTDTSNPGWIEEIITNILYTFALGIKNILGLKDVTSLIYTNDTTSNSGGTMSNAWWSVMLKYHLIFQVMAWFVIGLAIAKMLIELNFSSITSARISVMDMLQKIFIVGFLLALAIPIISLMTEVNSSFVGIFSTQAPADDLSMIQTGNTIASLVAFLSYIGILLMLNCTYIMRGIMIAIFGAAAPLFIVSMLFSKGNGMFSAWFKEMAANIFLQSVHAFSFAFLYSVIQVENGMLPKLVILYSLMPITEQFRGFIFGSSGGFTTKQGATVGSYLKQRMDNVAKTTAQTAGGIGAKAILNSRAGAGLKDSMEDGTNASGAGGSGRGGVGASGGIGQHASLKQVADAKMNQDKLAGGKSPLGVRALSAGISGAGKMFDQMSSATTGMMNMQMGDVRGAVAGMNAATELAGDMAVSTADVGTKAIRKAHESNANHRINKYNDTVSHGGIATARQEHRAEKASQYLGMQKTSEGPKGEYSAARNISHMNRNGEQIGSLSTGENGSKTISANTNSDTERMASMVKAFGTDDGNGVFTYQQGDKSYTFDTKTQQLSGSGITAHGTGQFTNTTKSLSELSQGVSKKFDNGEFKGLSMAQEAVGRDKMNGGTYYSDMIQNDSSISQKEKGEFEQEYMRTSHQINNPKKNKN